MEPCEAREIAAQAWCDNSTSHLDMIPELAEAFAKILVEEVGKASPASAPEGFNHSIGADRFTTVRGTYWWHVRAGDGTQNIGKFHTKLAAEYMALTLLTAFRDGAFMQYGAMSETIEQSAKRAWIEVATLREQVEKLTKERDEYKSGFEAAASKYRNLKLQMQEIINVC